MSTALPRRAAVVVLAAALALLAGTAPAWAHTALESSTPADGASVAQAPREIALTFTEDVPADGATVTVTGPDRADRVAGPVTGDGGTLTVPLQPLGPAGTYTVTYRVVSDDGHPVEGTVTFTLTTPGSAASTAAAAPASPAAPATSASPAPAPAASSTTSSDGDDGGAPVWPWIVAAVVLIGGGAALALRRSRS